MISLRRVRSYRSTLDRAVGASRVVGAQMAGCTVHGLDIPQAGTT
jgi:hypothetical protein